MEGAFLSKADREVLVKSVVQGILTFAMSCFEFPDWALTEIRRLVSNFWWGLRKQERKMHWVAWSKLCKSKSNGGVGFRDLMQFNKALLAKQGWRIIQNENSLVARIFKVRYFPNSTFLEAPVKRNCSFIWRSIASARPILRQGCSWRVGDGQKIRIWKYVWSEEAIDLNPDNRVTPIEENSRVYEPYFGVLGLLE